MSYTVMKEELKKQQKALEMTRAVEELAHEDVAAAIGQEVVRGDEWHTETSHTDFLFMAR